MAKSDPYYSSLNSGEFSPRMEARTDFNAYPNAAKLLRNILPYPQGGMTRRPGTRYVAAVKTAANDTHLIPFVFNESNAYVVEHGDQYMRFFRLQAAISVANTDAVVANGTFASNITSWTDRSTGNASIVYSATHGGSLFFGETADGLGWAEQAITIGAGFVGVEHTLYFQILGDPGGTLDFQVGTSSVTGDTLAATTLGIGYHAISFTPTGTTFYIQWKAQNSPLRQTFLDNVSFGDNAVLGLTSPYTTAQLDALHTFQVADTVYFLHTSHIPRKLERRGHTSWSIVEAFFEDGPYLEENPDTDLDAKQILINPFFEDGLTGWTDTSGVASSTFYHDATEEIAVLSPGPSTSVIARTSATIDTALRHVFHYQVTKGSDLDVDIGSSAGGGTISNSNNNVAGWHSLSVSATSTSTGTLHIQFEVPTPAATGLEDLKSTGIGAVLLYDETAKLMVPSGKTASITITALNNGAASAFGPFASADVGRLLRLAWPGKEPGYGVITAFASATSVTMRVLRDLPSTTPTEGWRFGAWGGDQGYPTTMGLQDSRLVLANTTKSPRTLWFSQTNDLQNMRPDSFSSQATSVEDDDAINVTLSSKQIDPVLWISSQKSLIIGTAGSQWVITSSGDVITPSTISAKQHSFIPSAAIEPAVVNNITLFADRTKKEIYDVVFSDVEQSFVPTDLTILADHMFKSPVQEIGYQRRPYSTAWCRRADGRLAALSYNRQHQILGWSQHIIGGAFSTGDATVESIAVIPGSSDSSQTNPSDERDELWMVVKRTINGATVRYIEFMEYFYEGELRHDYPDEDNWRAAVITSQKNAIYMDSAITYNSTSTTTITGLSHLEGATVKVLADGAVYADGTVASGQITISPAASKVHVGLEYKHRYESLKLAPAGDTGGLVNKVKIISGIGLVVLDTGDFSITTVDYDEDGRRQHDLFDVEFFRDSMNPSNATPVFSGEKNSGVVGAYSNDTRIYIEGVKPLPFSILGIAPNMEVERKPSR